MRQPCSAAARAGPPRSADRFWWGRATRRSSSWTMTCTMVMCALLTALTCPIHPDLLRAANMKPLGLGANMHLSMVYVAVLRLPLLSLSSARRHQPGCIAAVGSHSKLDMGGKTDVSERMHGTHVRASSRGVCRRAQTARARARARAPATSSSTTRRSCSSACTRPAAGRSRAPCARRAPRTAWASPSTCPCQARGAAHPQPPAQQHVLARVNTHRDGKAGVCASQRAEQHVQEGHAGGAPAAHSVSGSRAHAGDSGDAAMAAAFDEVVGPAAERFQPDIILARSLSARAPARAAPVPCTGRAAKGDRI
jgi:hypothetical protein